MHRLKGAKVLVADDDPLVRQMMAHVFAEAGAIPTTVADGTEVLRLAQSCPFDLVLLDLDMPGFDGLETLRRLRRLDPELPVLIVSGVATVPISIQATRLGVFDVVEKPVDPTRLLGVAARAVAYLASAQARRTGGDDLGTRAGILGQSRAIRQLSAQLVRVARYDVPVLVLGESGVGKELVARALHLGSARADKSFVAFNAAAVPENLFESALFGHVRGAFTGADQAQRGLMAEAHGGTLLLDEIGDLSAPNQVKLLRALETGVVRPVGSTREERVDVRIVACTNADLPGAVAGGRFRPDLYYRLRGVELTIPPLRDRRDDIPELAHAFLADARERFGLDVRGFAPEVLEQFAAHPWPGNVRELKQVVTGAALMADQWITTPNLPWELEGVGAPDPSVSVDLTLQGAERRHLERVLALANDNRTTAAQWLGISRSAMYRLLARHDLV